MKKRNTVFQHLDLYVRLSAQMGVRLKKRNTVFQHLDLYVRLSVQVGVKNCIFTSKFIKCMINPINIEESAIKN